MAQNNILGLLGLALRASRLAVGDDMVHDMIRDGKARCVFAASDAGTGITKKMRRLCEETRVPFVVIPETKAEMGGALGRSSCAVCATNDSGFAASAAKKLADSGVKIAETAQALEKKHARILERRAKPKKKGAGTKVTEYIDIEEEEYERRFGTHKKSGKRK